MTFRVYENGDHFALFAQPDAVLNDIADCITGLLPAMAGDNVLTSH